MQRFGTFRGKVGDRHCRFAAEIRHFTSISPIPARDQAHSSLALI
jgi:hypothetical protein